MRIRTTAVVFVMGLAWLSVLQEGTRAQSSCASAADCNDGNSCTDDACNSGTCAHTGNGSCTANPKTLGYWRKLCHGEANTGEFITDADVTCLYGYWSDCPYYIDGMNSVADVCQALSLTPSNGQDQDCNNGYEQVIALGLNICRGRLTRTQGVDVHYCGFGGSESTTVQDALAGAGATICADAFPTRCGPEVCGLRGINQGHALQVDGLVVSKLSSGGLHLVWTPPLADTETLTATPRSYRVWRASGAEATLVQIAEVAGPSFDDTSAEGVYFRYDITPVW